MQLLIDIPDEMYDTINRGIYSSTYDGKIIRDIVLDGTPLPKGHGDLIDRNAIEILRIENINREYDKGFDAGVSCMVNRILEAPTIIEADKESD